MSASRLIVRGNATVAINANATLLFVPGGDVYEWTNKVNRSIKRQTAYWAPKHNQTGRWKRPLRPHGRTPLKRTFVASRPYTRKSKYGAQVLASVGSTAHHALYVDQGTGIYGGNGPYEARLLPPWSEGSPSLYEATWNPGGKRVRDPVMIKGQPGKQFFDKGLRSAFKANRVPYVTLPSGGGAIEQALSVGWPQTLMDFSGSTTADAGFLQDLPKWRAWRDAAWKEGKDLGKPRPSKTRPKKPRATKPKVSQRAVQQVKQAQDAKRRNNQAQRDAREQAKALVATRRSIYDNRLREARQYARKIVSEYPNVEIHQRSPSAKYKGSITVVFYEANGKTHTQKFL